jgi:hypothetical protein
MPRHVSLWITYCSGFSLFISIWSINFWLLQLYMKRREFFEDLSCTCMRYSYCCSCS